MTKQDFIEQYVAGNGGRIETGVQDHNLSRHEMVRCSIAHAEEAWDLMQQQLSEQQEQQEESKPDCNIARAAITDNEIYVGVPEDPEGCSMRKVIFCPCGHFDGGVYVIFALYAESNGDYKLMVKDKDAPHAVSYESRDCVCMAKDVVGVNFEALPDMHFRKPTDEEWSFVLKMFENADLDINQIHTSMWHKDRMIN